jgi:putative ABC transport system substrate-binding protein
MQKKYIFTISFLIILLAAGSFMYFLNLRPFPSPFFAPAKIYKIGVLQMTSELDDAVYGFENRLKELGYVEGKNMAIIYRNTEGNIGRLTDEAEFLVKKKRVDLIYSLTTPATAAAKAATKDLGIPVVFGPVTDPVGAGLVEGLESSGNHLTGIRAVAYPRQKIALLLEQNPKIKIVGVIYRKGDKSSGPEVERLRQIVADYGLILKEKQITSLVEIPKAAEVLAKEVDALYGPNDGMVSSAIDFLIEEANKNRIPLITPTERGVIRGGLLYFGPNYYAMGAAAAEMADKIFKGEHPSDIPIIPPPKLWIAVNLDTAKKINQPIPQSILDRADYIHQTK